MSRHAAYYLGSAAFPFPCQLSLTSVLIHFFLPPRWSFATVCIVGMVDSTPSNCAICLCLTPQAALNTLSSAACLHAGVSLHTATAEADALGRGPLLLSVPLSFWQKVEAHADADDGDTGYQLLDLTVSSYILGGEKTGSVHPCNVNFTYQVDGALQL